MATADYPRSSTPVAPPAPLKGEPTATLLQGLARLGARRNMQLMTRSLMLWATVGLAFATVGVFAYRLYLIDGEPWMAAIPIVLGVSIGAGLGWRMRRGPFEAALDADRALGLKENLSSALAFARPDMVKRAPGIHAVTPVKTARPTAAARKPLKARLMAAVGALLRQFKARKQEQSTVNVAPTQWVPFLVSDAANRAQGLQPKQVYPWQWKKRDGLLFLSLLMFVGVCLMSNLNWLRSAQQVKEAQQLQEPAQTLQIAAKKVEDDKKLSEDPKAKRMAQKMAALGRKMMRAHMGKRDALVAMAQLKRELQKAGDPQKPQDNKSDFAQFAKDIQNQSMQSPEGKKLQEALGKDELNKDDLEKAAKQLDDLAKKLESGKMTDKEKKAAAEDLKKAADALEKQGSEQAKAAAEQLRKAAEELQKQAQQSEQGQKQGQQQTQQQGNKQGQNNKQGQGQNGQNQSQNQQGQKQQSGSQGSQSQPGGQQAQQGQQQGNQAGANALRQMANDMRGSQMGNSQAMQNMLSKIRQAEQQASQSPGSQAGQKPGQGQCAGGNCNGDSRESMTPGKDLKATDPHGQVGGGAGMGQRDHATGSKSGGGVSNKKSNRTGDMRRWGNVWSDRLPKTRKRIDRINGTLGDDGNVESVQTQTEAKGGQVTTPYYNVYESYKKDAEDAVSKEQVPPAYREPVKNYFDSLKPTK